MKKIISVLGYIIVVLSMFFLFKKISIYGLNVLKYTDKGKLFILSILAGLLYTFILLINTFSWYNILRSVEKDLKFSTSYIIYSRSQIAKYLPGNVFHYAGRQTLGHIVGLRQSSIFVTTAIETILTIIIALGMSISSIFILGFGKEKLKLLVVTEIIFIFLVFFSLLLLPKISKHLSFLRKILGEFSTFNTKQWFEVISLPFLLYFFGFILLGILLWIVAILCFKINISWQTFLAFPLVFATAWVLGFITPGAPGGIGIREAILTAGLSPILGTSIAISISIIARFIAILGDVFFYFSSYLIRKKIVIENKI